MVDDRLVRKNCSTVKGAKRRGRQQKRWIDVVREMIRARDKRDKRELTELQYLTRAPPRVRRASCPSPGHRAVHCWLVPQLPGPRNKSEI